MQKRTMQDLINQTTKDNHAKTLASQAAELHIQKKNDAFHEKFYELTDHLHENHFKKDFQKNLALSMSMGRAKTMVTDALKEKGQVVHELEIKPRK